MAQPGEDPKAAPDEPIEVTLQVTDVLERLQAPYFISGSMASIIHGMVRTTNDVDLVADLRMDQVDTLAAALGTAFYLDADSLRDAVAKRACFNVIHLETMFKVDIYLSRGLFDQARFQRRSKHALSPGHAAYVATAEDTILAKLTWYRDGGEVSERQWRDVVGLIKTRSGQLDETYLKQWAVNLDVASLLENAFVAARE